MSEFDAVLTVRRTRFTSEETGWAVVEALDDSGGEIVLVGPLSHLEDKESPKRTPCRRPTRKRWASTSGASNTSAPSARTS
jgi:hypothetical protein